MMVERPHQTSKDYLSNFKVLPVRMNNSAEYIPKIVVYVNCK